MPIVLSVGMPLVHPHRNRAFCPVSGRFLHPPKFEYPYLKQKPYHALNRVAARLYVMRKEKVFAGSGIVGRFFQNLDGHVIDSCIIENNNASVGTGFDVYATVLAKVVVAATEVVAYCLNRYVQLVGDSVHRAVGKAVFETTQVVKGDGLSHIFTFLGVDSFVGY